eukprot:7640961-Ditylum_brightwellii.AAC.1
MMPSIQKHTAAKIQRWALTLSAFEYEIVHVEGERNVWGDLLSRWGCCEDTDSKTAPVICRVLMAPLSAHLDKDFEWPSPESLHEAQASALRGGEDGRPRDTVWDESCHLWQFTDKRIWVPTYTAIKSEFVWTTLKADVKKLCQECLHCLATSGGNKEPRPYGEAMHSTTPNEICHMDYLFMQKSSGPTADTDPQYLHVMKDDATNYIQLSMCHVPTARTTLDAVDLWGSYFGVPQFWVSDGRSHYVNTAIAERSRLYDNVPHVAVAYSPRANGT